MLTLPMRSFYHPGFIEMDDIPLSTLIPALLVALVALGILYGLSTVLFRELIGDVHGFTERLRLKRCARAVQELDKLIEQSLFPKAISDLKGAFFLEHPRSSRELAKIVLDHNLAVLGRLVVIGEKTGGEIDNLALIEGLFHSRAELFDSYFDTIDSQRSIKAERAKEGKSTPAWGEAEFERKLEIVADKIITNRQNIITQVEETLRALKNLKPQEEVTYH